MAVRNNQAIADLIEVVRVVTHRVGLADKFRWPYNILDHQMKPNKRRIVLQLPLKESLSSEQYKEFYDELDAWIAAYDVDLQDMQMWKPTGKYLGFINIRVTTPFELAKD